MVDLFDKNLEEELQTNAPLADRMRPKKLEDYVGQEEIVGENSLLRKAIENDEVPSLVFWGPPGTGKTTLAKIIAQITHAKFIELSATEAGVKELREVIKKAEGFRKFGSQKTILFIDEIHRWNKAQQDRLLPYVERGIITLIGATTENPSFEIISPLLSRSRVYVLKSLSVDNLKSIINRALKDKKVGLGEYSAKIKKDAEEFLIQMGNGDARTILNALEVAVKHADEKKIVDKKLIEEALQHKALKYDKKGDEHYNIISAFIKSIRGSNVDGALYWLARMIDAGEDPKFIARRMVILASEDIGNAHSMALVVANAVFDAVERIGLPGCDLNLAQGVVYLAQAPKSNKSYTAIRKAQDEVKKSGALDVPLHLRNATTNLMKDLNYGKDYKYTHEQDDSKQEYLPEEIRDRRFYV